MFSTQEICVVFLLLALATPAIPQSAYTRTPKNRVETIAQYDENLARKLLVMAAAAYSTTPENCLKAAFPLGEDWKLANAVNLECDFLKNTCAAFIAISDRNQQITVAFRGTTTKAQLFLEAVDSVAPEETINGIGTVHQYFKNGLDNVWPSVKAALSAKNTKNYEVLFTGHSLGGALASLAAVLTVHRGFRTSDKVKLITFGQPRVGDSTYAMNHDRLVPYSFRIVYQGDIVPHLPRCKKTTTKECIRDLAAKSYYHHGKEVWYSNGMGENAQFTICHGKPVGEDGTCSNSLHQKDPGYSTSDHYLYFEHDVWNYGENGCKDAATTTNAPLDTFLVIRNMLINRFQYLLTG